MSYSFSSGKTFLTLQRAARPSRAWWRRRSGWEADQGAEGGADQAHLQEAERMLTLTKC